MKWFGTKLERDLSQQFNSYSKSDRERYIVHEIAQELIWLERHKIQLRDNCNAQIKKIDSKMKYMESELKKMVTALEGKE